MLNVLAVVCEELSDAIQRAYEIEGRVYKP